MPYRLSKSRYVSGLRCPKMLWLAVNEPENAAIAEAKLERLRQVGHRVGEYAQQLFKGGVLMDEGRENLSKAIARTAEHAEKGASAIFEATVDYKNILCRADILKKVRGKTNTWDLYEVKSSTEVRNHHYPDVAVQKFCFEGAGYSIRKCFLTHVNNRYVRKREIDPTAFITHEDLTTEIDSMVGSVESKAAELIDMINSRKCPEIEPGKQCTNPRNCDYLNHCHEPVDEHSIFTLYRGGKAVRELEERGITLLADVPEDLALSARNRRHVESAKSMKPVIDREALKKSLEQLEYPLYYLDFETVSCGIPLFDNTRPYQKVPFQFSLHIQKEPGVECEHREFLAEDRYDPRERLICEMLDAIGDSGSIIAHNASFEKGRIDELARDFSKYRKRLAALLPRFWDLMKPFGRGDYMHYGFCGKTSLKKILPVLVPSLSYDELEIQEGESASLIAERWYDNALSDQEWKNARKNLLKYCGLDTLAMVEILKVLRAPVQR